MQNPHQSRKAILDYIQRLNHEFVGRKEAIEMIAVSLITKEPMLLLGPPGTGKSDIIIKFAQGLGLQDHEYFEYMITEFTEPSEILGPIDIKTLREKGEYKRIFQGKLPEAKIVFLDEIFHGNSAILNTLLTLINERKVYQGGQPILLNHLQGIFGAANQIPQQTYLNAFKDRFILKLHLHYVHPKHFQSLLKKGLQAEIHRNLGQKPWIIPNSISLQDFENVHLFIQKQLQEISHSSQNLLPQPVQNKFYYLVQELTQKGIPISDREIVKLLKTILTTAYLLQGRLASTLENEDLYVLKYIAENKEQLKIVQKSLEEILGI